MVLVELDNTPSTTEGGIHIPQNAQTKSQYGIVIMVGREVADIKSFDKVLVPKYHGTEIEYKGDNFKLFHQKDILAIITQ